MYIFGVFLKTQAILVEWTYNCFLYSLNEL